MKRLLFFVVCFLLPSTLLFSQEKAKILVTKPNHEFGIIREEGGEVEHTFTIQNVGKVPLVIDRITTSCGCTLPEWSKEPVPPGKSTDVKVWYDPEGRPGNFYKTISVYSNAETRRTVMTIRGEVTRKPKTPALNYPYSFGNLKVLSKTVSFNAIRTSETLGEKIAVKNAGDKTISLQFKDLPPYITVEARPVTLGPDDAGEVVFLLNAAGLGKKGRHYVTIPMTIHAEGSAAVTENIGLGANVIDDFSKLSSADKAKSPSVQLSSTLVDFGKVEDKTSILGLGGKVSRTIEITNTGKSPLSVYSITCDDGSVDVSGGKKEIKPNSSATIKFTIRPKDIKTKLESTVVIVCNDPNGPVRLLKITAEK